MMQSVRHLLGRYGLWLIIALSVFPFVSLVSAPFVSDDWEFLYHAETLPYTAERMLGTNTNGHNIGGSYRPVVNVYWGTMYQLFGTSVEPYRISVLILQILAIVLVYQVVRRLPIVTGHNDTLALVAAACFAFFPGRVEALSWVAVINDTLLVPLLLISWLTYIFFVQKKQWYTLLISLICFTLAIGTKEVAVTFPGVLAGTYLLFALREKHSSWREVWKHVVRFTLSMLPYAVVLILFFILRYQIIGFVTEDYTGTGFSLLQNNPVRAYVSMLVATLLVDPLRTSVSLVLYQYQAWIVVVGLYALGVLCLHTTVRMMSIIAILASWYALAVFPASRFGVNMWEVVPSAEGERYTYYPSIFLAIIIAVLVVILWRRFGNSTITKTILVICAIGYLGYATLGTVHKVSYWQDAAERSETLLASFITIQSEAEYDGVVIVGLPDALYGAFMWRNAFALMLAHTGVTNLTFSDILTTPIRTVPVSGVSATIRTEGDGILYEASAPIITSPPMLETVDYTAYHSEDRYRERLSISYTDFTSGILVAPTQAFLEQNSEKHIGLFFFDGVSGWHHMPLVRDEP